MPSDPLACATPDNTYTCAYASGPQPAESRCVYNSSSSFGDPCIDDGDCTSGTGTCNTTLGSCGRLTGVSTCSTAGACGPDTYCNFTSLLCVPTIATGGTCFPSWPPGVLYDTNGGCAATDTCYNSTASAPAASTGVCTRLNSLAAGQGFSTPADSGLGFASVATFGALLCASGLAVPSPDTFGYSSASGLCVSALDLSQVGQPCFFCSSLPGPNYPLYGDGSLVCAPLGMSLSCILYPSSLHTPASAAIQVATAACVASARGPSGVPCARGSTGAGRCAALQCADLLTQADVLSATHGDVWPLWLPPNGEPQCVSDITAADALWRGALTHASLCDTTLPPAFAALGWTCGSPASFSLSSSPSLTASQTASPSASPTAASPSPSPSQPGCPVIGANCSALTDASNACQGTGSGPTFWPSFCNYSYFGPGSPFFSPFAGTCAPVPPAGITGVRFTAAFCVTTRNVNVSRPPPGSTACLVSPETPLDASRPTCRSRARTRTAQTACPHAASLRPRPSETRAWTTSTASAEATSRSMRFCAAMREVYACRNQGRTRAHRAATVPLGRTATRPRRHR